MQKLSDIATRLTRRVKSSRTTKRKSSSTLKLTSRPAKSAAEAEQTLRHLEAAESRDHVLSRPLPRGGVPTYQEVLAQLLFDTMTERGIPLEVTADEKGIQFRHRTLRRPYSEPELDFIEACANALKGKAERRLSLLPERQELELTEADKLPPCEPYGEQRRVPLGFDLRYRLAREHPANSDLTDEELAGMVARRMTDERAH